MERNFIIDDTNPTGWYLGRIVQTKNAGVWETQDRIGIVQYGDSSEEIAGPDYHRLKTMVKRSIEQNLRMKNFEARNGHFETSVVVKNQGVKQREQRSLGDCWHWKANGQCSKGDNCSFQHDKDKRAKSTQPNPSPRSSTQQNERKASRTRSPRGRSPSGKMVRLPCKDYLKGTCIHSTLWKMAPSRMLGLQVRKSGYRFGEKCSYAHRQVDEQQPSKRSKKNGDKSAVAMLKKHELSDRTRIWVSLRGPMTWRVMPRNVWNDIVSWQTERLNNSTKYQLHALTTITSKKKNWNPRENFQKYVLKLFWNAYTWHVLDDPIFYGQWTNLHDHYEMDQSLWQTNFSFDLLHSLHKWIQTILSCGKHCKTVQIGTVSRLRLCRRSWGFKIDIRWNIVHFRKPHVCSN